MKAAENIVTLRDFADKAFLKNQHVIKTRNFAMKFVVKRVIPAWKLLVRITKNIVRFFMPVVRALALMYGFIIIGMMVAALFAPVVAPAEYAGRWLITAMLLRGFSGTEISL